MILLALVLLLVTGCTDSSGARRVLEQDGYRDVKITGYRWWGCDKENFHTGFDAEKNGRRVTGVVCSGWLKGYTVRFD